MHAAHPKGSRAFEVLWLGQLVSNLGTQASLYGIGLWLLQQHWRVLDFAAVAIVVQAARLVVLPLLGRQLGGWPPRLTMLVANGIGASVVAGLVGFLLTPGNQPPVGLLLLALMVSAAAEAVLVLRFSSLISCLVPPGRAQVRAGGLFASADGLVLTMAPFLGAWLAGQSGLHGVLVLDGISFAWAFGCVLLAPWPQPLLHVPTNREVRLQPRVEGHAASGRLQFLAPVVALLREPSLAALAWLGMAMALVYASCEVLFPAWVMAAMGSDRLGQALLVAALGYGIGVVTWFWRRPRQPLRWLRFALGVQGLVLIGAGLVVFQHWLMVLWLGIFVFSAALPIALSALQCLWQQEVPAGDQPRRFALRFGLEWMARLMGFGLFAALVDGVIRPALGWPFWPDWLLGGLGIGPGRPMAIGLGLGGWLLLLAGMAQAAVVGNRRPRSD
jgi:DHA3 family macrolide efflux protein-like MFS transporter